MTVIEKHKPKPELVKPDAIRLPGDQDIWYKLRWFWRPEHGWRAIFGDEVEVHITADTSGFSEAIKNASQKIADRIREEARRKTPK